ncbi:hypothetical protein C5167_041669 [Papaver somniferum]|uniref:growth-regulating factor 1-like n=1 Tax=Papaver somniferum TaxID=3469 RepID=UPI000E701E44|nr:growth-regulating factor 1-like [Papaver somniferum]RZC85492.1 hypothetical protein C5167_041669 [Papaver somniferum]
MLMNGGRNKPPFTPLQWQELETQALIFKHMVSGIPIPAELLFPLKFHTSSSSSLLSSKLFLPSDPQIPWTYYHMGLGRKIDPEPGRCRRTDGKKWRCAKEAYHDSKYCEKHMHRGRNRSRKPVEEILTSTSNQSKSMISSNFSPYYNSPSSSSSSSSRYGFPYPSTNSTPHFAKDSTESPSYSRSVNGGGRDERSFFTEKPDLSLSNSNSWNYTPLRMNSSSVSPALQNGFSQFDHINHNNIHHQQEQEQQQQKKHCFVLGTDFFKPAKPEKQQEQDQEQHHHHQFLHFIDEYPPRNREPTSSTTSTQLSISIPHPFL